MANYALRIGADPLPAWLVSQPLNTWIPLSSSVTLPSGMNVDAWGGFDVIPETSQVIYSCQGGHGDSNDNGTYVCDLMDAAPAWEVLKAASVTRIEGDTGGFDGWYYDGSPTTNPQPCSAHTYDYTRWVPFVGGTGRLMVIGRAYTWINGTDVYMMAGLEPTAPAWDAKSTYPWSGSNGNGGVAIDKRNGNIHLQGGLMWTRSTNTWALRSSRSMDGYGVYPVAFDSAHETFFGLQFGASGFGGGAITAYRANIDAQTKDAITLTGSGLTAFSATAADYAAMDYDTVTGKFLWYAGSRSASDVYAITPTSGTTWDIELLSLSGTAPPAATSAGTNGRFKYVPALKGFVLHPKASSGLYFIRTAE